MTVSTEAAGDHRIGHALSCCDTQPIVIEEGALASFGSKKLVGDRVIDYACDDSVGALKADRDGKLRQPMEEIGSAV